MKCSILYFHSLALMVLCSGCATTNSLTDGIATSNERRLFIDKLDGNVGPKFKAYYCSGNRAVRSLKHTIVTIRIDPSGMDVESANNLLGNLNRSYEAYTSLFFISATFPDRNCNPHNDFGRNIECENPELLSRSKFTYEGFVRRLSKIRLNGSELFSETAKKPHSTFQVNSLRLLIERFGHMRFVTFPDSDRVLLLPDKIFVDIEGFERGYLGRHTPNTTKQIESSVMRRNFVLVRPNESIQESVKNKDSNWESYFLRNTVIKHAPTSGEPGSITFTIQLDLNEFCASGQASTDVMVK